MEYPGHMYVMKMRKWVFVNGTGHIAVLLIKGVQ